MNRDWGGGLAPRMTRGSLGQERGPPREPGLQESRLFSKLMIALDIPEARL